MKSDIRTLDLNLLKTLDALLDERSVTRAAQRLSLTQPAVSGMLNRLRDYFDDPLFSRTPHGIVPTLRAQQLAAPVKQILSDIDILLKPTQFDPLTWRSPLPSPLRITRSKRLLCHLLPRFACAHRAFVYE